MTQKLRAVHMGKKIDVASLEVIVGTLYPPPFDEPCVSRERISSAMPRD